MTVTWPMMGFFVAFIAAVTSGAVQLGTVQTHVTINTEKLNMIETRLLKMSNELATLKAQQTQQDARLDALERRANPSRP